MINAASGFVPTAGRKKSTSALCTYTGSKNNLSIENIYKIVNKASCLSLGCGLKGVLDFGHQKTLIIAAEGIKGRAQKLQNRRKLRYCQLQV